MGMPGRAESAEVSMSRVPAPTLEPWQDCNTMLGGHDMSSKRFNARINKRRSAGVIISTIRFAHL